MLRLRDNLLLNFKFFAPDDLPGPDDTLSLLMDDNVDDDNKDEDDDTSKDEDDNDEEIDGKKKKDDKSSEKDDKNSDEDDEDELDELEKELDEDEEDIDEEKLEIVSPARRKEILKAFPDLFKKFPFIEHAIYRDRAFTDILPTIEAAKDAVADQKTLRNFEGKLLDGETVEILKAVKEQNEGSFLKVVDNYLGNLRSVDERAFNHVVAGVINDTIYAMVVESKNTKNEDLHKAAANLNQFAFGSTTYKPLGRLAPAEDRKEDPKANELAQKEKDFNTRQFNSAKDGLNTRINNQVKSTLEANIDPKNTMTGYVKRNAIRDVTESLDSAIKSDKRFGVLIDRLWEVAFEKNFDQESLGKIRKAMLSKSKTLLPTLIKKARQEALRGPGKKSVKDVEDDNSDLENDDDETKKKVRKSSSSDDNRGKKLDKKKPAPGESTRDFFMRD